MAQVRISEWGIKNPVPVTILFIALVLGLSQEFISSTSGMPRAGQICASSLTK